MHITQGTFSYLDPLTDDEIRAQVEYGMENGWSPAIEFTDDPHPRNVLWEMWGLPMFDIEDASAAVYEVKECRKAYPNHYIRVSIYDPNYRRQTTAFQFMVNRPSDEPGFRIERQDSHDRMIRYSLRPYAANQPKSYRYGNGGGTGGNGSGDGQDS